MTYNFIRTITINGNPLVLRFTKISDTQFEVSCLNDKAVDPIQIFKEDIEWSIRSGGSEDIRRQSTRILSLIEDLTG